MKTKFWMLSFLLSVLALMLAGWVYPPAARPENGIPPEVAARVKDLTILLKRAGYEVSTGYMKQYTIADCAYSLKVTGYCFMNNPAAPYVVPVMPVWPEEWLDPATAGVLGPDPEGYRSTYRLDEQRGNSDLWRDAAAS
jgi:hypothetical protein